MLPSSTTIFEYYYGILFILTTSKTNWIKRLHNEEIPLLNVLGYYRVWQLVKLGYFKLTFVYCQIANENITFCSYVSRYCINFPVVAGYCTCLGQLVIQFKKAFAGVYWSSFFFFILSTLNMLHCWQSLAQSICKTG